MRQQLAKNFLFVSGLLKGFVRLLLSKLSKRTRYVLSLQAGCTFKEGYGDSASGGTRLKWEQTSGSTAKRTQRGGSSACVCFSNVGKFPGSLVCLPSVFWRLFPCVLTAWATLAFGPVVLFRWQALSSGPVILGIVLWALFLPRFFFLAPWRGVDPKTVLRTGTQNIRSVLHCFVLQCSVKITLLQDAVFKKQNIAIVYAAKHSFPSSVKIAIPVYKLHCFF